MSKGREVVKGKLKVLTTTAGVDEEDLKRLKEIADVDIVDERDINTPEKLGKIIGNYEAAIVSTLPPFSREVIEKAKRLKVITRSGSGYESIDLRAASEKGITVMRTPSNSQPVAEGVFGLILAVSKLIPQSHNYIMNKKWKVRQARDKPRLERPHELTGKTLGIIGMGRIGSIVTRISKGFNMKVLYYDAVRNDWLELQGEAEYRPLNQLLSESDFVAVCAGMQLGDKAILGEKELRLMKKDAILVNNARGQAIDSKALYKALKEKWIQGAGIDVWDPEPPNPDDPLLTLDNIVVTPHNSGAAVESGIRGRGAAVAGTISVLQGKKPLPPAEIVTARA